MKLRSALLMVLVSCSMLSFLGFSGRMHTFQVSLKGAYTHHSADTTQVILFTDGYFSQTAYADQGRRFLYTKGGPFVISGKEIKVKVEYDTKEPSNVGTVNAILFEQRGNELNTNIAGKRQLWERIDKGDAPLAGAWHITKRMQEGQLQTIHQTGTRKTIKLLTGNRFQWIAIDPGVKGFYGTGGGTYTFDNGKYTEHIGFFSRDSSRVGASLQFNGKLEEGDWHHSGKSSKGDNIYEVWSRERK